MRIEYYTKFIIDANGKFFYSHETTDFTVVSDYTKVVLTAGVVMQPLTYSHSYGVIFLGCKSFVDKYNNIIDVDQ